MRGSIKDHGSNKINYIGLSLGGGKTDRSAICVIEYFPDHKKFFLAKLSDRIQSDEKISADLKILEQIESLHQESTYLALDVPWRLPNCLRCELKCPGYESCQQEHIEWMWGYHSRIRLKKRPKKLFTPYTQRCVEMHLGSELEEVFQLPHALGSNCAPLLARAAFLVRRLDKSVIEFNAKISLWRIGRRLGMMKSQLRYHRHSVGGDDSRRLFLQTLRERNWIFIYEQDMRLMIENNQAFESFLGALTAILSALGQTQHRPEKFPPAEDWIEFPKIDFIFPGEFAESSSK